MKLDDKSEELVEELRTEDVVRTPVELDPRLGELDISRAAELELRIIDLVAASAELDDESEELLKELWDELKTRDVVGAPVMVDVRLDELDVLGAEELVLRTVDVGMAAELDESSEEPLDEL